MPKNILLFSVSRYRFGVSVSLSHHRSTHFNALSESVTKAGPMPQTQNAENIIERDSGRRQPTQLNIKWAKHRHSHGQDRENKMLWNARRRQMKWDGTKCAVYWLAQSNYYECGTIVSFYVFALNEHTAHTQTHSHGPGQLATQIENYYDKRIPKRSVEDRDWSSKSNGVSVAKRKFDFSQPQRKYCARAKRENYVCLHIAAAAAAPAPSAVRLCARLVTRSVCVCFVYHLLLFIYYFRFSVLGTLSRGPRW